jgi:hypothetical protein
MLQHQSLFGLSMTDLNIIRWLAQDAIERSDDFRRLAAGWKDAGEVEQRLGEELSRHYWITTEPPDARTTSDERFGAPVVRNTLSRRGVHCIDIPSWESIQFRAWWKACFLR